MWYMKQSTRLAMNNLLKYFDLSTVLFQVKFKWIVYEKLQPTNLCIAFYVLSFSHCTTLFLSNPMFNFKPHCWLEYLQYPESVCVSFFLCICNFKMPLSSVNSTREVSLGCLQMEIVCPDGRMWNYITGLGGMK